YGTTVSRLALPAGSESMRDIEAAADDWQVVYRTLPCLPPKAIKRAVEGHMAGGRLTFEAPATVYLGSGDYHWDGLYGPEALAQRDDNDYGKVLAVDLYDGSAQRLSVGHRNLQGILVDPDGVLWTVEHGPRGGDELNRIEAGNDYGWPRASYGTRYNGLPWPGTQPHGNHDGFVEPVYAWVPSIGISNLTR